MKRTCLGFGHIQRRINSIQINSNYQFESFNSFISSGSSFTLLESTGEKDFPVSVSGVPLFPFFVFTFSFDTTRSSVLKFSVVYIIVNITVLLLQYKWVIMC